MIHVYKAVCMCSKVFLFSCSCGSYCKIKLSFGDQDPSLSASQ